MPLLYIAPVVPEIKTDARTPERPPSPQMEEGDLPGGNSKPGDKIMNNSVDTPTSDIEEGSPKTANKETEPAPANNLDDESPPHSRHRYSCCGTIRNFGQ